MPESRTSTKSPATKSPIVPLVVAALAAFALIAGLAASFSGGGSSDEKASSATTSSQESDGRSSDAEQLARRQADDPMAMGDVDAPVVLIAYSEFQCPFCGKFARDTAPTLEEKYVEDGTLRIEWRDFPYLGEESMTAALAARAAAGQDRFWEFHDAMYADQLPPNSGRLTDDHVAGIAEEIGLDVGQFRSDMASDQAQQLVAADFQEGQAIGVTGTPSFLVNGTPIVGAQPTEVFEQAIEEAAGS